MGATTDRDTILKTFDSEAITIDATAGGKQLTDATFRPVLTEYVR